MRLTKKIEEYIDKFSGELILKVSENRAKLIFYILVFIFVILISFLPYFNLFFNYKLDLFLLVGFFLILFRVSWRKILFLCFLMFFLSLVLTLIKEEKLASVLADFTYGFIFISLLDYLREL